MAAVVTGSAPEQLNLSILAKRFSDEDAAYQHLESIRWPNGPICPHCGAIDRAYYLAPKNGYRTTKPGKITYRRLWKCGDCRQQFSVLVGTIFEDSHIPLSKWLLAIHLMCAGKNGVAALELSRLLGIAYSSAWFMAHRIRLMMARPTNASKLSGTVEADETYIGGKRKGKRGRGAEGKTPVVSLVERSGEVRSKVVPYVTGANIKRILHEQVKPDAVLVTDTLNVYTVVGQEFTAHETVDHTKDEYARVSVSMAGCISTQRKGTSRS